MSERYSKLFALSENLYSAGAPVVIAAGALQKDNQTGKVFAQLKIRNIQDKVIKAATVKIATFDTVGKPLGGTVDYQYLDLSAGRDTDFGQKTPVMLKEAATRSFAVSVSEVIFSDNSIWTASNEAWEPLSAPIAPEKEFTDGELAKQYRAKYGADCKCIFKKEKDLWRCACGAINHDSERNCHSCQREAAALAALNVDELKADRDKRLAAEQKAEEEQKAAAAEQAKKTKKIAMFAVPVAIVAIVAAVLIAGNMKKSAAYQNAAALAAVGKYDEAIATFTELGNYKDSAEQIESIHETMYKHALALARTGKYLEAVEALRHLGDYRDSSSVIEQLNTEYDVMQEARTEVYRDTEKSAKVWEAIHKVIQENKYITFSQEELALIEKAEPYVGDWQYVSGDQDILLAKEKSLNSDVRSAGQRVRVEMGCIGKGGIDYLELEYSMSYPRGNTTETVYLESDGSGYTETFGFHGSYSVSMPSADRIAILWTGEDGTVLRGEYERI